MLGFSASASPRNQACDIRPSPLGGGGGGVGHETIKQAPYVILLFGFTIVVVKEVPYIGKFPPCKRFA